jgi:hypothetical protein
MRDFGKRRGQRAAAARVLASLGIAAVLAMSAPSAAQSPEGHGIAGFWNMGFGPMAPSRNATPTEAELMAHFPDGTVILTDTGLTEFPPGDYGGLAIHDALVEDAKDYDPESQTTVSLTCRPPGLIYSMQGPFPLEIFEGRDMVVIKLEYFDLVRVIFMNETAHPADWPASQTGHSYGRWDGETLVVHTAHLSPGTLFNNGVDYTDRVELVERFRLANPNTLVVTQEFRDPGSFDGTAARVLSLTRGDDHVYPYDCDPAYGLALDGREGPEN